MYAKIYKIRLKRFKDKSKNVHWPHLLDHAVTAQQRKSAQFLKVTYEADAWAQPRLKS